MIEAASITEDSRPRSDARAASAPQAPAAAAAQATTPLPHVLFLIDRFVGPHSGAESALVKMIRLLPREKFRCSLVIFGVNPALNLSEIFSCTVYCFNLRRTYDWNAMKTAWELSSLIRRENVSIVHSFFETSDLWGGTIAKLSGVPILVSSRRDMGIQREKKHDSAYKFMRRFTDLVLPVSNQVRDFCIERDGLDPKKVVTLYNGVEIQRFDNNGGNETVRYAFGLENSSHIISAIANIRPVKGLDVMIRAAAIVCRKFPRAYFVIVGMPHRAVFLRELKALARELGIAENIRFLGGHDEIERFLKISNVFCLPSRSEGFSNSLIEAMGCGLPCVATDVGGNREALEEGVSGYLVANEDSQSMGERIVNLLENPEPAHRMGAAGRRKVEQMFTAEAMMSTLIGHYQSLLDQKCNGRQS